MKKTLFAAALFSIFFSGVADAQTRWVSRYWDGCKPTCSWNNNASSSPHGLCKECDIDNNEINPPSQAWNPDANSCLGGGSYTCWDQVPFVSPTDPNTAYGFGATNGVACGQCFEVTFDGGQQFTNTPYATNRALSGKKLIIMGRNTGGDVGPNQIDFLVPGGGVGRFDSFSKQLFGAAVTTNDNQSATDPNFRWRFGGLLKHCEETLRYNSGTLAQYQTCLRDECNRVFNNSRHSSLRQGCLFYADWMMAANNPTGTVRTNVTCPPELVARYRVGGGGGGNTTYTITFNVNGGNTLNPATATTGTNGRLTTLPTPTRSNFNFNGWFTAATGGTAVTTTTTFNANTTIFAQWTAANYTITFNPNGTGGSVTPTTATTTNGRLTTLPTPTRAGFTFNGWFTAATGGTAITTNTTFNANTTIYAQWTAAPTTYTVTYNVNGGTGTAPATQTVNAGINVTLASGNGFTRTGFTFGGWNTNTAGSGTNYDAGTQFMPTANVTLYARWIANAAAYTITFNVNGGNALNPSTATTGTNGRLTTLPTPTRSNFTFNGWFTAATGGTAVTANTTFTANTTIFAQWTAVSTTTFTVTYNANGGTGTAPAAQTVNQGSSATLASGTGLTRTGFTFGGWNTDAAGTGTDYNAGAAFTPTANTILYAKWNSTTITIPGNRTDTTRIEAESLTETIPYCIPSQNNSMCIGTENGITNIGWITSTSVATYSVTMPRAGAFTMQAMVALNQSDVSSSGFTVIVNGRSAGTITTNGTGGWDNYAMVTLGSDVHLNAGENTIILDFQNAINVDYFVLLGEAQTWVNSGGASAVTVNKTYSNVVLKPVNKGFTAALPHGHGYHSYTLVDLQGREVRRGKVNNNAAELHFNDMKQGVLFLRLKGSNTTTVLKAVTF